jgi:hypothetical protein
MMIAHFGYKDKFQKATLNWNRGLYIHPTYIAAFSLAILAYLHGG